MKDSDAEQIIPDSGDNRGAIEDHNKAIELKPDDLDAYFNRGISRSKLGEKDKAIADYQKAADLYLAGHPQKQIALDQIIKLQ